VGARRGALLLAVLIPMVVSACSSTRQSASGPTVLVVEHDFGVTVSPDAVAAGWVTFHVENRGPSTHELLIDRSNLEPQSLPLLRDTLQIDEHAPALVEVAALEQIRLNSTHDVRVRLTPGHYVLFCNLEGHYLGGMNVSLQVRE
jgi:uncharacterized cupredoxin-like copper-binding protein